MLTTFIPSRTQAVGRLAAGLALVAAAGWAANFGNTLNITTGTEIIRTWDTTVAQGFVYGPKQSYSVAGTSTNTHIYLPYGDANGVYYDANTVSFQNAAPDGTGVALAFNNNGPMSCAFTFKLHFDQAISAFAMQAGYSAWNLASDDTDVIAGAAQYSTDGATWTNLWTATSPYNTSPSEPFVNPLTNGKVTGITTQDLYLRFATYDQTNPADTSGGTRYMQLRTAGAGNWGEGGFLPNQMQLDVTTIPEPAALSLLAIGGLLLARRRTRA